VTKLYPQAEAQPDVATFGVIATLCTSASIPADVVYALTSEVFENFESFRRQHPAFADLSKQGMLEGLSAPLHPGALRYYRETGLIP
jgi:TRAP transporter TAXI family solute receptor